MRIAFFDALVTGWQDLVPTIHLPNRDDRHVVAIARPGLLVAAGVHRRARLLRGHQLGLARTGRVGEFAGVGEAEAGVAGRAFGE
jgi:hypothetical protein